jgi:hypothetical protein
MFATQQILLCFLSKEVVAITMREAQLVEEYERQSVEECDESQSAASLRGERTSKDFRGTESTVRNDCNTDE